MLECVLITSFPDQLDQVEVVEDTPNGEKCVQTNIVSSAFDAMERLSCFQISLTLFNYLEAHLPTKQSFCKFECLPTISKFSKKGILKGRAQTWSSYKYRNTVNFLVRITPQRVVPFISSSWCGRTSDKHITENWGVLTKILPGHFILADSAFDIHSTVMAMCAE
ncbi:hypothetical protein MAR_038384, partial [Mya arenaria]